MTASKLNKDSPQLLISDLHRLFASAFYRGLKEEGVQLTRAQWRVLALLRVEDGRTQSELAEIMLMEKAPMGVLLDKLESKALIQRKTDSKDRRAKRIFITEVAQPLMPIMEQLSNSLVSQASQGLNSEDQEALARILNIMCNNLNALRQQQA